MTYIYDIILNFNKELIEHFEWEQKDRLKYAKRIILFKVNNKTIKDILKKEIEISNNFIKKIPKYEMNGENTSPSICLIGTENIVLGLQIKENKIDKISRLLLDEEKEVIEKIKNLEEEIIDYKIIKEKENKKINLTRKELIIKEYLEKEINNLYKNNDINKLKYLYYEYTNKENNNKEKIYKYLIKTLNNFNKKHNKIYNILIISNKKTRKI